MTWPQNKDGIQMIVAPYLEPKQCRDEDEELRNLKEDRPVLDFVKDEPGSHHAQPGYQEGQPDLEQGCTPTFISARPAYDYGVFIVIIRNRSHVCQSSSSHFNKNRPY